MKAMIRLLIMITILTLFAMLFLLQPEKTQQIKDLPWHIQVSETEDTTTVFGLTLGKTTLLQTRHKMNTFVKIAIFEHKDKAPNLEAFFQKVTLGKLYAKVIVNTEVSQEDLEGYKAIAVAKHPTPSGAWKYELPEDSLLEVQNYIITSLVYSPKVNFTEEIVIKHFGKPEHKHTQDENIQHWFYPQKALAITLNQKGRELFHYVRPSQYDELKVKLLTQPLISQ